MVKENVYRIIERAVALRLANGEDLDTVVDSYTKLSDEQNKKLKEKFAEKE